MRREVTSREDKVTVKLEEDDINLLKSLVSKEIDRVGVEREKHGSVDPTYFYRLVDIRNKLLGLDGGIDKEKTAEIEPLCTIVKEGATEEDKAADMAIMREDLKFQHRKKQGGERRD